MILRDSFVTSQGGQEASLQTFDVIRTVICWQHQSLQSEHLWAERKGLVNSMTEAFYKMALPLQLLVSQVLRV